MENVSVNQAGLETNAILVSHNHMFRNIAVPLYFIFHRFALCIDFHNVIIYSRCKLYAIYSFEFSLQSVKMVCTVTIAP